MDIDQQAELSGQGSPAPDQEAQIPTVRSASYWYEKRHEEKQQALNQQQQKQEEEQPKDFVTRDEFMAAQRERQTYEFARQNPEFAPYVDKVLQYWNHPTRSGLPVESVFADAIGAKELMRLGAEKAKKEAEEAASTRIVGGSKVQELDSSLTTKDIFSMSSEDFKKVKEKIRGL